MFVATLAISGIPGFSGFFSKDEILWQAYSSPHGHFLLWLTGAVAAGLTAFYMFRLLFMTFFNENRAPEDVKHHIHESPKSMTVPLMVLAVLSAVGGYLGVPHALGGSNRFHHFLEPVMGLGPDKLLKAVGGGHGESVVHNALEGAAHAAAHQHSLSTEYTLMTISVIIALIGIYIAYVMYMKKKDLPAMLASRFKLLHNLLFNKWFVDEIYDFLIIRPYHALSNFFWKVIDVMVIDGIVNGVAKLVGFGSSVLRLVQTGYVQAYAVSIVFGTVALMIYYFLKIAG